MGCATPEGATGGDVARQAALRAGLPITVGGVTVNRFCSSGLQTIAMAAQRIIAGEADVFVAGGVESISCVQNEANRHMATDPWLVKNKPEIYWNMLQTAENVAKRYNIAKERMDEYGAGSQQRASAAQEKGLFNDEIAAIASPPVWPTRSWGCAARGDGQRRRRPASRHHAGGGAQIPFPAIPGGVVTAGNASQFSDGAGACVLVSDTYAQQKGLKPWATFWVLRWRAASPTRWVSARCLPCPSCSSAWA